MNNIKPKDRSERIANRNRDNIEKAYLGDRVGMFNKPSEKAKINDPDPNSNIFISEAERFNKDFASIECERRQQFNERKKQKYENFKNILFERERKRWEKMDYEFLKNESKVVVNKEKNMVGRKNNPGYLVYLIFRMAFNPLTLEYDKSVQGEILKNRDEQSQYRALLRSGNIDKHFNSKYNILTGEDRSILKIPDYKPKQFSRLDHD